MTTTTIRAELDPAVRLLVTTSHPSLYQHPGHGEATHPALGRLIQPRSYSSIEQTAHAGIAWAADNDCYRGLRPENEHRFVSMLERVHGLPGCRFVTVPDQLECGTCGELAEQCDCPESAYVPVGRADLTRERFDSWAPRVTAMSGQPLAYVLQDGVEWAGVPWDRIDAVFVGGSTDFKEGPVAAHHAREAAERGLWVHWGRVNTRRRFNLCVATGACDSFDGSKFARWRKTWLDQGLGWCDEHTRSASQLAL